MTPERLKPFASIHDLVLYTRFVSVISSKINRGTAFDKISFEPFSTSSNLANGIIARFYSTHHLRSFDHVLQFEEMRLHEPDLEEFASTITAELNDSLNLLSGFLGSNKLEHP